MADVQIAVIDQQTTQLSVIDQENTQLALAAPDETQVSIAVPGVQGPKGEGVPLGGSANQVLFKQSGTNYDTAWGNVTSAMIGDLQIVNADVAAAAAIAGTKISPDFGSQTVQTTGVISHALGTAGAPTVTFTGDTNTGIYSPGADQLAISTGGTGRLFITANGIIGVNVSNPSGVGLHLKASNSSATGDGTLIVEQGSSPSIQILSANNQSQSINFGDPQNNKIGAIVYAHPTDDLFFKTAGGERLRIDSSGRLLVGTSSAFGQSYLQIQGDQTNGATGIGAISLRRGDALAGLGVSSTLGRLEFGFVDGGVGAQISAVCDGATAATNDYPGRLVFSTTADGAATPTERLRITSAGLVGVGTSTPDVRTHIVGTALTKSWSADANDIFVVENNSTSAIDIRSGSAAGGNVFFSDGDARSRGRIEYSHVADELRFGTAGTNSRVVIDSSGRLLVGTSAAPNLSTVASPRFPKSTIFNTAGNDERQSLGLYTGNTGTSGPILVFTKNKATSTTSTLVASGDETGSIAFSACDGSGVISAASIAGFVDGTPGANDMPGRLVFSTTADGAASPTERLRIDSSGRLLVGTSTSIQTGSLDAQIQLAGTSGGTSFTSLQRFSNNASSASLYFGKSRGTSAGSFTAVQADDILGAINFFGANGTDLSNNAVSIRAEVDGEPFTAGDTTDLPGRLVFSTTADGSGVANERLRITSTGQLRLAGAGITFNGDTATANELDDYEEGTWTVSFYDAASAGNVSATTGTGTYTKVGRLVTATFNVLNIDTTGLTAGNVLYFTLPFSSTAVGTGSCFLGSVTVAGGVSAYVATIIRGAFYEYSSGNAYAALTVGDFTSGAADVFVTVTYNAS